MLASQTSEDTFRAGQPSGWTVADEAGLGEYRSTNDVGVAWSPSGDPVVIAALARNGEPDATTDDALFADLAALVARRLG
ncbi:MAG: hypothetical protein ACRDO7_17635 [Nocardioidaceae bacterium]